MFSFQNVYIKEHRRGTKPNMPASSKWTCIPCKIMSLPIKLPTFLCKAHTIEEFRCLINISKDHHISATRHLLLYYWLHLNNQKLRSVCRLYSPPQSASASRQAISSSVSGSVISGTTAIKCPWLHRHTVATVPLELALSTAALTFLSYTYPSY